MKHNFYKIHEDKPDDFALDLPDIRESEDLLIYALSPNKFRLENGNHNGPECKVCGVKFCEWCNPEKLNEECEG